MPLRQEGEQVSIRWFAPRLSSDGSVEELRLRKAIVSYRLLDLDHLATEARAAERTGSEDAEEEEILSEDEAEAEASASETPETEAVEGGVPDPGTAESAETAAEGAAPAPDAQTGVTAEPGAGETLPEEAPPAETDEEMPAAMDEEVPAEVDEEMPAEVDEEMPAEMDEEMPAEVDEEMPAEADEEMPAAVDEEMPAEVDEEMPAEVDEELPAEVDEAPPAAADEELPAEVEALPDEASPDAAQQEESPTGEAPAEESDRAPDPEDTEAGPDTAESGEEEADSQDLAQPPESEDAPEPQGVLLDYEDLEFEVLSEVDSEALGEERVLELPVDPEWIGRRLEVKVQYESRGGSSEESEPQSLDVTGPLPAVEGVSVEVGPGELAVRWQDPRTELAAGSLLANPGFDVFRRRGAESERLGRSLGPTRADPDVIWGEEVCYRVQLVMVGGDDERVLPDPGPEAADVPAVAESAGETPAADEAGESGAPDAGTVESESPEREAELAPEESEPQEPPWSPIPIRVPGTGSGALSVGPLSAEACVLPVDVFPPLPPADLRLFWRAEQTELSWEESASPDVVGYHVYRSGPDGSGFERLTRSVVGQTTFSDASRDPRGGYRYAVTAVDGADPPNESLPSESRRANPR